MDESVEQFERRKFQRFMATRRGDTCFWVVVDGERYPLIDLSLEGFCMPTAKNKGIGDVFDFELRLDFGDRIGGKAIVANIVAGNRGEQLGCRFQNLGNERVTQLREWLTSHVIAQASVRISVAEAEKIVTGPSLV